LFWFKKTEIDLNEKIKNIWIHSDLGYKWYLKAPELFWKKLVVIGENWKTIATLKPDKGKIYKLGKGDYCNSYLILDGDGEIVKTIDLIPFQKTIYKNNKEIYKKLNSLFPESYKEKERVALIRSNKDKEIQNNMIEMDYSLKKMITDINNEINLFVENL